MHPFQGPLTIHTASLSTARFGCAGPDEPFPSFTVAFSQMVYGYVLPCLQHGSYGHREIFEEHRGRLRPARKNTMFYIRGPCQA